MSFEVPGALLVSTTGAASWCFAELSWSVLGCAGLPLCEVLAHLRAKEDLFPRVEIKYNEQVRVYACHLWALLGLGFRLED